jgi:hypothetical protein
LTKIHISNETDHDPIGKKKLTNCIISPKLKIIINFMDMKLQVLSAQDDYPFGSLMPGRSYNANGYRFGFNGQKKDDEVTGVTGSWLNFKSEVHEGMKQKTPLNALLIKVLGV